MKLDFGCGPNKRAGFTGVDRMEFPGVDVVLDIVAKTKVGDKETGFHKWPWEDNSVEEAHASHFVEHLKADERIHFVNELYRVLKPGAKATIICPHWSSCRAYGDLTHQWPPVCEFWFYYLRAEWRKVNAPHNDFYHCDFEAVWGYNLNGEVALRNQEYQQFAANFYKEACQDIVATLIKR
jgi:hypothetical protein